MTELKRALIFGAGQRVREAALPAFQQAEELFEVKGLVARSERELTVGQRTYPVRAMSDLGPEDLEGVDLVFLCVSKDAIPKVLRGLAALRPAGSHLLIDTPVVRFKHFRATRHLAAFRGVSVAEDCTTLPWMPLLGECLRAGDIGRLERIVFDGSAWAYHGLAMARFLSGAALRSGVRKHLGGERFHRRLRFGRVEVEVQEPRDYTTGKLLLEGERGCIADHPAPEGEQRTWLELVPLREQGRFTGVALGERRVLLDEKEQALVRDADEEARVTGLMEPSKRVGFLRFLRRLHAGQEAYPLASGLDDMVADYHLEKFGRFVANPFTTPRGGLGRWLLCRATKG